MVSVSRRAGPPHLGQVVLTNSGTRPSGEPPGWVISTFSGSSTGQLISGTGTRPHCFAVDHGDRRAPVALAADAPILQAVGDRCLAEAVLPRRYFGHLLLRLFAGSGRRTAPELISTPSSATKGRLLASCSAALPRGANDDARSGRPYFLANSKSRSSCAGTLMMAPVP